MLNVSRMVALGALALGVGLPGGGQATVAETVVRHKPVTASKAKPSVRSATAKKSGIVVATNLKARAGSVKRATVHTAVAASAATKAATERVLKLNSAFVASAQLRPMAQQLANTRTAAAFAGVSSYAASHPGAGAATAYLALGHAYGMDHKYGEAADAYRKGLLHHALTD